MGKGTIKTKAMTMAVAMSMVAGLCPSTVFAANSEDVAEGSGWNIYRDCSSVHTDGDLESLDKNGMNLIFRSVTVEDGKI